jgi:hypothetical protein
MYSKRTELRRALATIDSELSQLEAAPTTTRPKLRAAWQEVVTLLDLGSEPVLRACPNCQLSVRSEATLCGHCWTPLHPADGVKSKPPPILADRLTPSEQACFDSDAASRCISEDQEPSMFEDHLDLKRISPAHPSW